MAQTPPPATTPLPIPPSTTDPVDFDPRADAWGAAQDPFRIQMDGLAANAYGNAVDSYNSALASAGSAAASQGSANDAASSATAAMNTANVAVWTSGSTVQQFANVISRADARTYRRATATGSGTTDPAFDPTNYVLVSPGPMPRLRASHRLATGTNGGSSAVGFNVRSLNTLESNTIVAANLSSNQISLPAGIYTVSARAPANNADRHQLALYNVTDSSVAIIGGNELIAGNNSLSTSATLSGRITISGTKLFELRHWFALSQSATGLGQAVGATGLVEIYSEITIEKVS